MSFTMHSMTGLRISEPPGVMTPEILLTLGLDKEFINLNYKERLDHIKDFLNKFDHAAFYSSIDSDLEVLNRISNTLNIDEEKLLSLYLKVNTIESEERMEIQERYLDINNEKPKKVKNGQRPKLTMKPSSSDDEKKKKEEYKFSHPKLKI